MNSAIRLGILFFLLWVDFGEGFHKRWPRPCLFQRWTQRSYFSRTYGKSVAQWLHELVFLGPRVSLAHGVWLCRKDSAILAHRQCAVVHNPSSNLTLRSGIVPLPAPHGAGLLLALGLDSIPLNDKPDLLQEMRLAANLQRIPGIDSEHVSLTEMFRMAMVNGSRVLGWETAADRLEPGKQADMVLLDTHSFAEPYLVTHQSRIDTPIYRGRRSSVDTVIVGRNVHYQKKKHLRLRPKEIIKNLTRTLIPPSAEEDENLGREILPHVLSHYQRWDADELAPFHRVNSIV